jgi:ribosomal protein S18 acetylase RimI-like enzyme
MSPSVRRATSKDKPAIMSILNNAPEFRPAEIGIAEELIDSHLADPVGSGYDILVAEVDSEVAGYICWGPTPLTEGTWDIYWIAVATGKQREGIGTALLKSAEDRIRQNNGRLIFIETSSKPEYEDARRFYISNNYKLICQIADFYAPGDDKLIFRKKLRG